MRKGIWGFALVAIMLLICVLIARLYYLQIIQYDYHSTLSENNRVHVQPIPPNRGLIFDRNGVIIADNRPSFSLTITRERTEIEADLAAEPISDEQFLAATLVDWDFKDKTGQVISYTPAAVRELCEDWDGFEAALVRGYTDAQQALLKPQELESKKRRGLA